MTGLIPAPNIIILQILANPSVYQPLNSEFWSSFAKNLPPIV